MEIRATQNLRGRFKRTKEVFIETNLPFSDKDIDKAYQIDSGRMFKGYSLLSEKTFLVEDAADGLKYLLDSFIS